MEWRSRPTIVPPSDAIAALAVLVLIGCFATIAMRSRSAPVPAVRSVQASRTEQTAKKNDREALIEEIALEHVPGLMDVHREKVVMCKDGTVTRVTGLWGRAREAKSRGRIGPQDFRQLERLLERTGFFEMEETGYTVHGSYVEISALRVGSAEADHR